MRKIIARFKVPAENLPKIRPLLKKLAQESQLEPGCLRYDIYEDAETKGLILIDEAYQDEDAIERHRNSAHFQELVPKVVSLVSHREVETY